MTQQKPAVVIWPHARAMQSFAQRFWGLLRQPEPSYSQAFWFPRCRAIHTYGMKAPIDVLAVDRQLYIVAVKRHLCPSQSQRFKRAYGVIELSALAPWPLEHWIGQQLIFLSQGERCDATTQLPTDGYFSIAIEPAAECLSGNSGANSSAISGV
ncbi:MAG: DUF192 domain-containing protein [Pseudomonadota bacterium]